MNVPANSAAAARPSTAGATADRPWPSRRAAFIAAAAGLAIIPAIFAEATTTMVSTWLDSNTFNHGPMIPALAAYLAWQRREQLAGAEPRFEWAGLAAVGLALLVWLAGRMSATMIVQQFGLVFTLQAFVLCVLGRTIFRQLLFPLFYLVFAVPFGAELVPPLQDVTAFFVVSLLRLVGIPVFMDGVFIATPAGNYLVAEACAGLRYLISTVALGLVFANLAFRSWRRRAIFMGLSLVVPIVANGIRAFLIVLIAYVSDNEIATGIDHIIYGWIFFSFVTFLLFAIGYAMREPTDDRAPDHSRAGAPSSRLGPIFGALAVIGAAFAVSSYADSIAARAADLDPGIVAPDLPGFAKAPLPSGAWRPVFHGADLRIEQIYSKAGRSIDLHIGLYARERKGAKAVTDAHDFAPGDVWSLGDTGSLEVTVPDGRLTVMSVRMSARGRYRLVWHWYWVAGEFTGNPYIAKWRQTKALLAGDSPAVAIVAVSAEYLPALGEPTDLFREVLTALPVLQATLAKATRGGRVAARAQ